MHLETKDESLPPARDKWYREVDTKNPLFFGDGVYTPELATSVSLNESGDFRESVKEELRSFNSPTPGVDKVVLPTAEIVKKFLASAAQAPIAKYDLTEALDYSCSILEFNDPSHIPVRADDYQNQIKNCIMDSLGNDSRHESSATESAARIAGAWATMTYALRQVYINSKLTSNELDGRGNWYYFGHDNYDIVLASYGG